MKKEVKMKEFYEAHALMQKTYERITEGIDFLPEDWTQCLHWDIVKAYPDKMPVIDIEYGFPEKYEDAWVNTHDYDLDCHADTFEEAIIKLAALTKIKYLTD